MWAEGRANYKYEAIETPVGRIPHYKDLQELFRRELSKEYTETETEYIQQFSLRLHKYLEKMDRMKKIFENIQMPAEFSKEFKLQIDRLQAARERFREEVISPF